MKNGIVAENGTVVTDEMIAGWESALERDEWPGDWDNVGEVVEGRLPKAKKVDGKLVFPADWDEDHD